MSIIKNNKYLARSGTGYVYSTDNNEFTGTNTFTTLTANGHNTIYKNAVYEKGSAPTIDTYIHSPHYYDKDNKLMASEYFYVSKNTTDNLYLLRLFKNDPALPNDHYNMIMATVSKDGLTRTLKTDAITTATSLTSDNQIATTGWVNDSTKSTNVVHRDGSETITGAKTFTSTPTISTYNPNIWFKDTETTKGTAPSAIKNAWFGTIYDKNGTAQANKLAQIYTNYSPNGAFDLNLACFLPTNGSTANTILKIGYDASKNAYSSTVTPTEDTTSSVQIDTVGARNTKINAKDALCVHLAGAETITGTKTFTQTIGSQVTAPQTVYNLARVDGTGVTGQVYIRAALPHTTTAENYGVNVAFGGYGATVVGSGESISNVMDEIKANNAENMYITSDNSIYFYTYANTYTDKKTITFDTTGKITCTTPDATNATTGTYAATTGWVNDPTKSTNVVHRTGAETIAGVKTFTDHTIHLKNLNVVKSDTVTETKWFGNMYMKDSADTLCGCVQCGKTAAGSIVTELNVNGTNGSWASTALGIAIDSNGVTYTYAPTPGAGDNSTKIATTAWCYDPAKSTNLVHRTGDETIGGTKTFSSVIQGTAYRAYWGDLAEHYAMDEKYPIGTLVKFGGEKEMTIAKDDVNAVISENPGFILNGEMPDSQPVALIGRVNVRIIGQVEKFDKIALSSTYGVGCKAEKGQKVIGVALEDKPFDHEGLVLCSVKINLD